MHNISLPSFHTLNSCKCPLVPFVNVYIELVEVELSVQKGEKKPLSCDKQCQISYFSPWIKSLTLPLTPFSIPHERKKNKNKQTETKQKVLIIYTENFPSLMIFNCSKKEKMVLSIMRCQIQKKPCCSSLSPSVPWSENSF